MPETKNDQQDVALENNEPEVVETPEVNPEVPKEEPKEPEVNVDDVMAENAKLKRINEKLNKQIEKPKTAETQPPTEKPNNLDYGEKAFLKAYGITGSEELALVRQFQDRGFDLDSIVGDDVFTAKLENLREAKTVTAAIPKGNKRSGQSGVTDVDLAVAKYKETGELPKDFKTRTEVINKAVVEPSKSETAIFDN